MKVLKLVAVGLGVLAALLVTASIAVYALFDPNDYKGYVTDWVETSTGRHLEIADDLELSLFPWLAVETGGVTLGNAPGFDAADFARIERVSARVRLLPLLRGRIEIGDVRIDGLSLDLATTAEGRSNWDDLTAAANSDTTAAADPAGDAAGLGGFAIASITLRGARVTWRENTTEPRYVVSDLDLDTGTIAAGRPLDVSLALRVLDVASNLNGTIDGTATALVRDDGGVEATDVDLTIAWREGDGSEQGSGRVMLASLVRPPDGALRAGSGTVTARLAESALGTGAIDAELGWEEITMDPTNLAVVARAVRADVGGIRANLEVASEPSGAAAMQISGRLDGGGSARELLGVLGSALPPGVDPAALGNFTLRGSFTFDTGTQRLDARDIDASVLGITVRAQEIGFDQAQGITGRISSDGPVAGLLTLTGTAPPAGVTASELGDFSSAARFAYHLDTAELSLTEAETRALGITAHSARLTTDASTTRGRLEIAPVRLSDVARRMLASYVPAEIDVSALGRVGLRFDAISRTDQTTLSNIEAELFGANLTGEVTFASDGSTVAGNIATNRFASNELLAVMRGYLTETIDPASAGNFAIATRFRYDAKGARAELADLRLEVFGLSASGAVTASGLDSAASYSGRASLAAFNPRDVLGRFGMPIPQTSDDQALRRASVEGTFRVSADTGTFENLSVALDQSRITGALTVHDFSDPSYEFELSADTLDVDRYLPPTAEEAAADERTAGDIELSNEQLTALKIDGSAHVGALRLAGLDFQNVATGIRVGDGRMLLDSAQANLYGGSFNGRFEADATTATPSLKLTGRTAAVQLEPLLRALAGDATFSGTANFDIDLTGHGPTITDNLHSAAGTMGFTLTDGAIEGFNVDEMLCTYYNRLAENPPPAENPPDRTAYQTIRGTANVTDGVARSNDLFARAGSFEVRGNGSLSIVDVMTDYKFEARLAQSVPIRGCATMDHMMNIDFPLTMTGPVTAPSVLPDFSEVVKRVIQDRIKDQIQDRLLDRLLR